MTTQTNQDDVRMELILPLDHGGFGEQRGDFGADGGVVPAGTRQTLIGSDRGDGLHRPHRANGQPCTHCGNFRTEPGRERFLITCETRLPKDNDIVLQPVMKESKKAPGR